MARDQLCEHDTLIKENGSILISAKKLTHILITQKRKYYTSGAGNRLTEM